MRRIVSLFAVRLVSILFGLINDILRFAIGLTKPRIFPSESNWPSTGAKGQAPPIE